MTAGDAFNVTTDTLNLVNLLVSTIALIAGLAGALAWFKRWLRKQVAEPVAAVKHEVQANDGKSLKDAVVRTEGAVETLNRRLEHHLEVDHARRRWWRI